MKKLTVFIAIILLCLVTWAGATYVIGSQIESRYTQLLEDYPRFGPISFNGQNFQRGLLSSSAQTVLRFEVPATANKEAALKDSLEIVLDHHLKHGPLIGFSPRLTEIETCLAEIRVDGEPKGDFFEKMPQLRDPFAVTRISFDGITQSRVDIASFSFEEDDAQVSWDGFSMDVEYSPAAGTFNGSMDMPGMKMEMADGSIKWNGINGRFDLEEVLPKLFIGSQVMTIGSFDMLFPSPKDGAEETVQMKEIKVTTESQFDGRQVHYQQVMQLDGLTVDGETYGPGTLDIALRNLDAQPLSDFQARVQELYFGAASIEPDQLLVQLLPLYTQLFQELGVGQPELVINKLAFATPQGNVDGHARIHYKGTEGDSFENPLALLQNLYAEADLAVAETLVRELVETGVRKKLMQARDNGLLAGYTDDQVAELATRQVESQIGALLSQNFIVREEGQIKSSATFKQGQLEVNGQMLPLF